MLYSLNNGGKQLWYHVLIKQDKNGKYSVRHLSKNGMETSHGNETIEEALTAISDLILRTE